MLRTITLATLFLSLPLVAQVVINEVDYDQIGTDTEEFIEIKNIGSTPFPMGSLSVVLVNGNTGLSAVYGTLASAAWPMLNPGEYFLICANPAMANCNAFVTPATNLIQNGAPDAIALVYDPGTGPLIIDALSYEGSVPGYTEGTGTAIGDNNMTPGISLSRWPDGMDTDDNIVDFRLGCSTPGATNNANPADCDLSTNIVTASISEASFTVLSDAGGEHIMLYYGAPASETVTFEVFTAAGALLASHSISATTKAAWNWQVNGMRGELLLVRASTNSGSMVRRIVVP